MTREPLPGQLALPFPLPAGWVACNRCNAARRLGEHPCPDCGCPEYRLSPEDAANLAKPKRRRKAGA